jgi:hypothetical protein
MKSYRGNYPKDALTYAIKDVETWSAAERNAMAKIINDPYNSGKPFGSGRNYKAKGSKIIFYIHESSNGFNVGRW